MTTRLRFLLLALASLAPSVHAHPLQAWLPPQDAAITALQSSPLLRAAQSTQQAQQERARGTELGAAEWSLRASQQRRHVQTPGERLSETAWALERPLRLWGKTQLDAQLAQQEREMAHLALADARHEARRQLLTLWFAGMRSHTELEGARRQLQLAQALVHQARVRLRQGDISRLDAQLAEAEWQRCEAATRLAQADHARNLQQLALLFPGLPEPQRQQEQIPLEPVQPGFEQALQTHLTRHHALRLLRAQAQHLQQRAERLERERWPDPTVGVFTARERAGNEQVVGLSLSLPLPGAYREQQARSALAEAQALQASAQQLEREVRADFSGRWQALAEQEAAWRAMRAAAEIQNEAASQSWQAYTLGEHSMTELIHNRRLASEQTLASERMALDWRAAQVQIELDAHRLWDLDD